MSAEAREPRRRGGESVGQLTADAKRREEGPAWW